MKTKLTLFKKIALATILVCFSVGLVTAQTGGFANVSIGGTSVTVTSASQLLDYIGRSGQYTINVSGTIYLSGMNKVTSNKAILGVGTSARIVGGGFNISGVSNVVVQNIAFSDWDDDAINVQSSSTNIWIDHCSFTNGYDGCVDIKRGSDYITVSWNHFYNHHKTCLLGHSDDNASQDVGHLRVTYHHNYFDGTESRHPRVRFSALCHVYNNYYKNNGYGVASTCDAEVLVEGNYFQNVSDPTLVGYGSSWDGDLVQRNNVFSGSGSPETSGSVPNPSYSYSMDNASSIPSIVSSGAGPNGTTGGGGSGDTYYIQNRNSGKNVDVNGKSQSDGADIIQWTSNGGTNQQWQMVDAGSGYVYLKAVHSGKCMRALSGNVVQYTCNTGWWSEMFERVDAGSGYYLIKNRSTGTCLRPENSSTSDGASIVLYDCSTGYWSEQFSFSSVKSAGETIETIESVSEITIYPNPADNYLNIVLPDGMQEDISIKIVNSLGQVVTDRHNLPGELNIMDISNLDAGMYIVQVYKNQEVINKIFTKK